MLPVTPPEVSVVIPAFNEERHLGVTIRGALVVLDRLGLSFELVVVDDGSTDASAAITTEIARTDPRVRLVQHPRNAGLGASYVTGVNAASGTYLTWLPGDDAIPPESLAPMIEARKAAEVIITYPVFDRPRPWYRRALSITYVSLMNAAFGFRVRYFNCITLMRRELLLTVLSNDNRGFGLFAEILVRLLRAGHNYVEIPVSSRHRAVERSKALHWRNVVSVCHQAVWLWWSVPARPKRADAAANGE